MPSIDSKNRRSFVDGFALLGADIATDSYVASYLKKGPQNHEKFLGTVIFKEWQQAFLPISLSGLRVR